MSTMSLFNTVLGLLVKPGEDLLLTNLSDNIAMWSLDQQSPGILTDIKIDSIVRNNEGEVIGATVLLENPLTTEDLLTTIKKTKYSLVGRVYVIIAYQYKETLTPAEVFDKTAEWVNEFNRKVKYIDAALSFDYFCNNSYVDNRLEKPAFYIRISQLIYIANQLLEMYPD